MKGEIKFGHNTLFISKVISAKGYLNMFFCGSFTRCVQFVLKWDQFIQQHPQNHFVYGKNGYKSSKITVIDLKNTLHFYIPNY